MSENNIACAAPALSHEILYTSRSKGTPLTTALLHRWADRAEDLENKLSGTAHRSQQMECEALRLQEVNTKLTDENIKLYAQVDSLSRSTPECVTLKARIKELQEKVECLNEREHELLGETNALREDLRIQKLETLAAHGRKRDADTAWQKEVDSLKQQLAGCHEAIGRLTGVAQQPQTYAAGSTALHQHNDRSTMKHALRTALDNGTWLSSELLVDAVLMQLFPYPGKEQHNLQVPAPRHVSEMSFEEVTRPVIEWLNEFKHPMHTVIIENDSAVLTQSECAYQTTDYLKD